MLMTGKEHNKSGWPLGHILAALGYMILGGLYIIMLIITLIANREETALKNELEIMLTVTENEFRDRAFDDVLGVLTKTGYRPYHKLDYHEYKNGYNCLRYYGIALAFKDGKFESYDRDTIAQGTGGICSGYHHANVGAK
jgi:hypothetical protein